MLQFGIKFAESYASIERRINMALRQQIRTTLMRASPGILKRVKEAVRAALGTSRELSELVGGPLQAELGVPNPNVAIQGMINEWVENIGITAKVGNKTSSLALYGIRGDWSDVLAQPASKYTTAKGQVIPWLEWLLMAGDATFLVDYDVSYKVPKGVHSRTGQAIMVRSRKSWGVPSWAAGTESDNFVTRSLSGIYVTIEKIMTQEIIRYAK